MASRSSYESIPMLHLLRTESEMEKLDHFLNNRSSSKEILTINIRIHRTLTWSPDWSGYYRYNVHPDQAYQTSKLFNCLLNAFLSSKLWHDINNSTVSQSLSDVPLTCYYCYMTDLEISEFGRSIY